ncbi:sulfite exporter TauE/SafE family protein [Gracilimonas sediminicola]|uniref:Probable membrane transporter protein n=1 Tax=Gracilimonas sediminicola TaxID=2952158 RepID=A0A9X2RG21_9BACT|nr:sulfite exporter TauE/SafE family protein [Gracilimonas sediminicola]MCP9290684.1 sulfite exporter TauE/SafE family protein [Gracilimonas sediminicola]
MWLAWCGALLIGISLGLLGSGGSILTVPVLIYLVGEPEKLAIAESLGIVAAISFIGSIPYVIKKEVHWVSLIFFGIPGMIGTYGGASLSQYISGNTQLMIFAGVMIIAAYMMIRERTKVSYKKPASIPKWVLVIEGLVVGVLTGLVGVGGGFLIIPALVLIGGLSMRVAVGTSLLIITLKSILGFYKYIDVLAMEGLEMNWELIGVFSLIGIAGSFVGNKISQKVPQKQLKTGFGYFLMVMGAYIIYTNF